MGPNSEHRPRASGLLLSALHLSDAKTRMSVDELRLLSRLRMRMQRQLAGKETCPWCLKRPKEQDRALCTKCKEKRKKPAL
jgi:uncharacterized paraquat-inducible protein A